MSKVKSQAGKGMTPRQGYNAKNWYKNYDRIFKSNKKNNGK